MLFAGSDTGSAAGAVIMLHGRGASAADILSLAQAFDRPDLAWLAPEAANHTWYPQRFLVPAALNQPYLDSALGVVGGLVDHLDRDGIGADRVVILGFSQGACLATEFVARNPRRYGGLIAFTGGLIGDRIVPDDYSGSLAGTPVFIGSSDPDPHIPLARVKETSAVLTRLGGEVTERIYPGLGHTISIEEVREAARILDRLRTAAA